MQMRRYAGTGIHPCTIAVPECWPQLTPRANICQRLCRWLRESTLPTYFHPETKHVFKSMYTFRNEKSRMIYHCSPLIIHPFSGLVVMREVFAFFFCYVYVFVEIFRIYMMMYKDVTYVVIVTRTVQILLMLTRFLVGYVEIKNDQTFIVLDAKKIAMRYLKTVWLIDFLEIIRIAFLLVPNETVVMWLNLLIFHIYILLQFLTKVSKYLKMVLIVVFNVEQRYHGFATFIIFVIMCVHYNTCFLYGIPRMHKTLRGENCTEFNRRSSFNMYGKLYRYLDRMCTILLCFFKTTPSHSNAVHMKTEIFVIISMFFLNIYILVFMLMSMKNMNHAAIKYGFMWTNVLNFLQSRNIGGKLRYKILAHYEYRFQYKYFDEAFIIKNLSKHLQYENMLHTCSHLIVNVGLLRGLPKTIIGRIIAELQPVVFLPNDIISKWKMNFDGIYFISYGTVAMFSSTGREVLHLEDGGILGAIGYYTGINYLTITSVTITELYKWNMKDVNAGALICPELSNRLKMLGRARIVKFFMEEKESARKLNPVLQKLALEGRQLRSPELKPDGAARSTLRPSTAHRETRKSTMSPRQYRLTTTVINNSG